MTSAISKNSIVATVREHWAIDLPSEYQDLRETGALQQALTAAASMTLIVMQSLHDAGFSQWEAWEMARAHHLILPEEQIGNERGTIRSSIA